MVAKVDVRITFNRIPEFLRDLQPEANQATHDEALLIAAEAASLSRVDTGAMREGWYAVTPIEDGYPAAVARAKGRKPTAGIVDRVIRQKANDAAISNVTAHTVFNEYGTTRMTARPMLHPAAEHSRRRYPLGVAVRIRNLAGRLSK